MNESAEPFDRWHKTYPKPHRGDRPCRCGTRKRPLYPSADHSRGKRWQARYTDATGAQRRSCFDTWQQARDHLDRVRMATRSSAWDTFDAEGKTVEFYARQLIERKRKKKKNANTVDTYESHFRNHIAPFAGYRPARTLRRRDSMAFVDYLLDKSGLSSSHTVVQVFKTWRILMNYMVDEDVPLPTNIVSRIELPGVEERVSVALSPGQVTDLAEAIRKVEARYEVLVWIGACAGLRQGEAFGLKQSAVAWRHALLRVEEQRQHGQAVRLKTKSSYATLPVDHFLIERLVEHVSRFSGPAPVSKRTERRRQARGYVPPPSEGLIVTNRGGWPVQRSEFNAKWRAAVRLAELSAETRFHDLKHFYTSRLGASGHHDPKTVQALSRHAEFSETWDTYAHPPLAVEGVKVTAFSALFAQARSTQGLIEGYSRGRIEV